MSDHVRSTQHGPQKLMVHLKKLEEYHTSRVHMSDHVRSTQHEP